MSREQPTVSRWLLKIWGDDKFALVLWTGWGLLRVATHVLMEGVPRSLDSETVLAAIGQAKQVVDVHHLHLWNLASDVPACSAHVVLAGHPTLHQAQQVATQVKAVLAQRFALTNVTLEVEEREPVDKGAAAENSRRGRSIIA